MSVTHLYTCMQEITQFGEKKEHYFISLKCNYFMAKCFQFVLTLIIGKEISYIFEKDFFFNLISLFSILI